MNGWKAVAALTLGLGLGTLFGLLIGTTAQEYYIDRVSGFAMALLLMSVLVYYAATDRRPTHRD